MRYFTLPVFSLLCILSWASASAAAPGPVKIEVDTTDCPELADFGKKVQEVADRWYPIIVQELPSDGFRPPTHVVIVIRKDKTGVAAASGDRITASAGYFARHLDDVGALVHELTHVVQAYHKGKVPGWLTEGIADYIRWFKYEPQNKRPHPDPNRAKFSDSYRTSAAFLNWAAETYDKGLVVKINAACRDGQYNEELWKKFTGKTLEELNEGWIQSLRDARNTK